MAWRKEEAAIREKRTVLAVTNNYMGPTGKLGIIARYMGQPIIRQGGSLYDENCWLNLDPYEEEINGEYETTLSEQNGPLMYRDEIAYGEDQSLDLEGYIFDGLSSGIHMDITFWSVSSRIIVNYKGFLVYKETAGELDAYAPIPEWENIIEKLYVIAKKRMKKTKELEEAEFGEEVMKKKRGFFHRLRMLWGV